MRKTVAALLLAGAFAQPQLGAPAPAGAKPAPLPQATAPAPTGLAPQVRGTPIGTVNGIMDSDVACAQNGYRGAACGLQNIASIYNPNPALRYQTELSDQALTLLTSTGRYSTGGGQAGAQRVINPATGNAFFDLGTVDIPVTNAWSGGVVTSSTNDPFRGAVASQTNWISPVPSLGANAWTPSQSNALLPNSVAFGQANVAPWTTTAVNPLTSAGLGYSTAVGQNFNGGFTTPVASWNTAPTNTGFQSAFGQAGVVQNAYSRPGQLGVPSQFGAPQQFGQFGVPTTQFGLGAQFGGQFGAPQFAPQFGVPQFGGQFGVPRPVPTPYRPF